MRSQIALVLIACLAACGGAAPTGQPETDLGGGGPAASPAAGTIAARYGELEPRIAALDAFAGRRDPVVVRMERSSVEGVTIVHVLDASRGRAVLSIDETADGGGVRTYTLSSLQLVRLVPGRWEGNVEVAKERFEVVDIATARAQPADTYLLVHPKCLTDACAETF
ncbi:MAG: hypothetical protein ACREON_01865 [Gemmatimonadaceae bacterium]